MCTALPAKRGSSGIGGAAAASDWRCRMAADPAGSCRRLRRWPAASARVAASGTVGPEATKGGVVARDVGDDQRTTTRAGWAASARASAH